TGLTLQLSLVCLLFLSCFLSGFLLFRVLMHAFFVLSHENFHGVWRRAIKAGTVVKTFDFGKRNGDMLLRDSGWRWVRLAVKYVCHLNLNISCKQFSTPLFAVQTGDSYLVAALHHHLTRRLQT